MDYFILSDGITQGSRNYLANEWVKNQAAENVFNLGDFNEDSLYNNLDWLTKNQDKIEQSIFNFRSKDKAIRKYFYTMLPLLTLKEIKTNWQTMVTIVTKREEKNKL